MREFSRCVLLFLIFLFSSTSAGAATMRVGDFLVSECSAETFQLRVEIPTVLAGRPTAAGVLVRGVRTRHPLPEYLPARSDGWTNLSSEKSFHNFGHTVSNCLPEGLYRVRIEYSRYVSFVGWWLVGAEGYTVGIGDNDPVEFDYGRYPVTLADHISMHGALFLFYTLSVACFIASAILLIRVIRRG